MDFKVDENDLIRVDDADEFLLDDITCLVRTLNFSKNKWYVLFIRQEELYEEQNEKLFKYLAEEQINYLKEISDGEIWITFCDSVEIPDHIYEEAD